MDDIDAPKPEKKKTRKGKKGGASPQDEDGDEGEVRAEPERNGEQRNKKVVSIYLV